MIATSATSGRGTRAATEARGGCADAASAERAGEEATASKSFEGLRIVF
jgi:hypothetical protein